jgi:hypothetical protein
MGMSGSGNGTVSLVPRKALGQSSMAVTTKQPEVQPSSTTTQASPSPPSTPATKRGRCVSGVREAVVFRAGAWTAVGASVGVGFGGVGGRNGHSHTWCWGWGGSGSRLVRVLRSDLVFLTGIFGFVFGLVHAVFSCRLELGVVSCDFPHLVLLDITIFSFFSSLLRYLFFWSPWLSFIPCLPAVAAFIFLPITRPSRRLALSPPIPLRISAPIPP